MNSWKVDEQSVDVSVHLEPVRLPCNQCLSFVLLYDKCTADKANQSNVFLSSLIGHLTEKKDLILLSEDLSYIQ